MRLLVAGGERVDAGKTTFTTGLLDRLGAVGFKPRAGNDYWFDHDDYRRAVEAGRLYGKDAKRLAEASASATGTDFAPEDLNPVHRLWQPSPGPDTGLVGQARRQFVLDRVGESFVVNARAEVPRSARERLPLDDAPRVASVEELDEITRRLHLPMLEGFADRIREVGTETEVRTRTEAETETRAEIETGAGTAVVESYGDVAVPIRDLSFDAVAVVEPGRMRAYDGDRFLRACEVAGGSPLDGKLEVRTPDVTDLADPKATAALPALPNDDRRDPAAVARAYETAYDDLLAVAEQN